MALVLIVLAVGSVVAGFVGVPHALGGSNRLEAFLEPSFEAHRTVAGEFGPSASRAPELRVGAAEPQAGHAAESAAGDEKTELMLMALSSGIALAGIGIASYFWLRNRASAAAMARRFRAVYTLLLNKYYVDEIYDAVIVQPIKQMSVALWKGFDVGVIDGAVNGVGGTVRATSGVLRRLQTGSIRAYAASLFLGVVVILGWYLSR
jgi:NADH-quinone oxidoreductase subunit L